MGLETHCFAWDNESSVCKNIADFFYPISVLEKHKIYKKCKEIEIDGITTIATDICIPTVSYIAEKLNLTSNSYKSSLFSTNKTLMRERFLKKGVKSPKNISLKDFSPSLLSKLEFPMIVKPTDRSGSKGITKVHSIKELRIAFNKAKKDSIEKKVIIEEYIEGEEVSVEFISWKGKHFFLTITDKVTTNYPHFVELQHHQPSQLSLDIQKKLIKLTKKALNALKINYGASHSEFKIDKKGEIIAIEVGARMGGDFIGSHLVELSTGYDYTKGVIDIALNNFEKPVISNFKCSGIYFLAKETEYLLPYFYKENIFDIKKSIQKDKLSYLNCSNDRSGYLIYQSSKKTILK